MKFAVRNKGRMFGNTDPAGKVESCPYTVAYEKDEVLRVFRSAPRGQKRTTKRVYLECDAGHTHPYEVSVSEE